MLSATPEFEWPDYFAASDERGKLNPLFEQLRPLLRPGFTAVDLGCGVGRGACFLAELGLAVTAVDIYQDALHRLTRRLAGRFPMRLIEGDLRALSFPEHAFDVMAATSVLYFLSPAELASAWPKMVGWLKPGGLFAGQLMGPHDPWVTRADYNVQTVESVQRLFEGFEILSLVDEDRDVTNTVGMATHMHQLQVLARKQ